MGLYQVHMSCTAVGQCKTVPIPKFLKLIADGKDHYGAECVLSLYLCPTSPTARAQKVPRKKEKKNTPKKESVVSDWHLRLQPLPKITPVIGHISKENLVQRAVQTWWPVISVTKSNKVKGRFSFRNGCPLRNVFKWEIIRWSVNRPRTNSNATKKRNTKFV